MHLTGSTTVSTVMMSETLDQPSAGYALENCKWLFTAILDMVRGGKIHHRDGSTRRPPPIETMENFPKNMGDLDDFIVMPNQGWIMGHGKRHRLQEEGVIIEPPKSRKDRKQRAQFIYDDDAPFSQDNTAFVVRIKISSTDLLRNGISALKWIMSSMLASISMDRDQSPQSILVD